MTSAIHLHCPAKVNLALSVGAPDETGYHPIASWMSTLGFGDSLQIRQHGDDADARGAFDIAWAEDAPQPAPIDWPIEQDLTYRAHELLEHHLGRSIPVAVTLRKRIPAGAGLAGGSSNAAGMLVGLDRLLELRLQRAQLIELGMQLGSDIGFLVAAQLGQPSAIVEGRGERIAPLAPTAPLHLVLVLPKLSCATGAVYQQFDKHAPTAEVDAQRVMQLAVARPVRSDPLFNDLADAACAVEPALTELRSGLGDALQQPVHVSGSGSTLFLLAGSGDEAKQWAKQASDITGLPAVVTQTLG
jgi:4-diphosphocytidyl-2-C-methyl-D-erythritol kinase